MTLTSCSIAGNFLRVFVERAARVRGGHDSETASRAVAPAVRMATPKNVMSEGCARRYCLAGKCSSWTISKQ